MRLRELWISKYKNIEDITIKFTDKLTTLLVGLNGYGKSNLLEAIVIIFRELDLAEREKDLTSDTSPLFFDFTIEYTSKGNDVNIVAKNSEILIKTRTTGEDSNYKEISFSIFKKLKDESFFPDFLIGYYSGENKRVQDLFKVHFDKRISNLKNLKKNDSVLGKLFFTEQNYGELIFFTLWVFKDTQKYGEKIKELFQEFIGIDFSSTVQIDICNPDFYKNHADQNAEDLFSNIQSRVKDPFWGITGDVDKLLQTLYNNNLETSTPISFIDEDFDPSKIINEFVQFQHLNFKTLINDIKDDFDTPVKFFDILQAADSIKIIHKINTTIIKRGVAVTHDFRELSEGEQQLLTTIGLLLIIGEFDALFLYDEPDTHLNPQWQREYARLIHRFNLNEKNSQIIVSTHSPLIVQASETADLFLFRKEDNLVKVANDEHRIKNWRIDQVLQSEYFELENTRPPSLDEFMQQRESILLKDVVTEGDIEELKKLDNTTGDLPTGETINDFMTMHLLKQVVKKLTEDDKN